MNDTYFDTQAMALEAAFDRARAKGYEVIVPEQVWTDHVNYGTSVTYTLDLTKDGKPQRKGLIIVLYRMDSGKYELTSYIN